MRFDIYDLFFDENGYLCLFVNKNRGTNYPSNWHPNYFRFRTLNIYIKDSSDNLVKSFHSDFSGSVPGNDADYYTGYHVIKEWYNDLEYDRRMRFDISNFSDYYPLTNGNYIEYSFRYEVTDKNTGQITNQYSDSRYITNINTGQGFSAKINISGNDLLAVKNDIYSHINLSLNSLDDIKSKLNENPPFNYNGLSFEKNLFGTTDVNSLQSIIDTAGYSQSLDLNDESKLADYIYFFVTSGNDYNIYVRINGAALKSMGFETIEFGFNDFYIYQNGGVVVNHFTHAGAGHFIHWNVTLENSTNQVHHFADYYIDIGLWQDGDKIYNTFYLKGVGKNYSFAKGKFLKIEIENI